MPELKPEPVTLTSREFVAGPGIPRRAPISYGGTYAPPAYGTGEPVFQYRFKPSAALPDEQAEWLPAEEATHDDLGNPLPRPRRGHRHLLVHLDPERHHSAGEVALRLNVPEGEGVGAWRAAESEKADGPAKRGG